MAKQIVILCEGTGHSVWRGDTSHLTRLHDELASRPADAPQFYANTRVLYVEGVGAKTLRGALRRLGERVLGNVFGFGLNRDIRAAYAFLCEHYEKGDAVYIFGWSRGAYIARSLIGLVRSAGLYPHRDDPAYVQRKTRAALRHYRSRAYDTKPWLDPSRRWRARHSPGFYTGDGEGDWRALHGIAVGERFRFAYAGIWDTVGVKGVQGVLAEVWARGLLPIRTPFHDQQLSKVAAAARHAVGIDEISRIYPATLWDHTLDAMNDAPRDPHRPYQQEWFPGNHGAVGGSNDGLPVSYAALDWVLEGATGQGLTLRPEFLNQIAQNAGSHGALRRDPTGVWGRIRVAVFETWFGRPRDGLERVTDVNQTGLERVQSTVQDPIPYQPGALRPLWKTLWRGVWGKDAPPINPFSK